MSLAALAAEPGLAVLDAQVFHQRDHRLFSCVFPARDLVRLTTVDHYRSDMPPEDQTQGYQRPPERSRITRIGSYLLKELGDGLFPTALVLAARQPIPYDPVRRQIRLSPKHPLQVIDGQHRVEGLRYVIEEKGHDEFADYPVPAIIVELADRTTEMNQFRIINGTAKSVRTDLVNAILTATATTRGDEAIKDTDRWKVVVTKAVDALNREVGSPWIDRIAMPDELGLKTARGKIVRATSFMTSLKPVYTWMKGLGFFSNMSTDEEAAMLVTVLKDFWNALAQVNPGSFETPQDYVIQKTPGIFSLHILLHEGILPVTWHARRPWSLGTFVDLLKESPEITDARFWHVAEGRASAYGSFKGFRDLADLLIESIRPTP